MGLRGEVEWCGGSGLGLGRVVGGGEWDDGGGGGGGDDGGRWEWAWRGIEKLLRCS